MFEVLTEKPYWDFLLLTTIILSFIKSFLLEQRFLKLFCLLLLCLELIWSRRKIFLVLTAFRDAFRSQILFSERAQWKLWTIARSLLKKNLQWKRYERKLIRFIRINRFSLIPPRPTCFEINQKIPGVNLLTSFVPRIFMSAADIYGGLGYEARGKATRKQR